MSMRESRMMQIVRDARASVRSDRPETPAVDMPRSLFLSRVNASRGSTRSSVTITPPMHPGSRDGSTARGGLLAKPLAPIGDSEPQVLDVSQEGSNQCEFINDPAVDVSVGPAGSQEVLLMGALERAGLSNAEAKKNFRPSSGASTGAGSECSAASSTARTVTPPVPLSDGESQADWWINVEALAAELRAGLDTSSGQSSGVAAPSAHYYRGLVDEVFNCVQPLIVSNSLRNVMKSRRMRQVVATLLQVAQREYTGAPAKVTTESATGGVVVVSWTAVRVRACRVLLLMQVEGDELLTAVTVLYRCTQQKDNDQLLREDGLLDPMLQLLNASHPRLLTGGSGASAAAPIQTTVQRVVLLLLGGLKNVSQDEANQRSLITLGILVTLADVLRSLQKAATDHHCTTDGAVIQDVLVQITGITRNLSEFSHLLVKTGLVKALFPFVFDFVTIHQAQHGGQQQQPPKPSKELSLNIVRVLSKLTGHSSCKAQLVVDHDVAVRCTLELFRLIQLFPDSRSVLLRGSHALGNLFELPDGATAAVAGSVEGGDQPATTATNVWSLLESFGSDPDYVDSVGGLIARLDVSVSDLHKLCTPGSSGALPPTAEGGGGGGLVSSGGTSFTSASVQDDGSELSLSRNASFSNAGCGQSSSRRGSVVDTSGASTAKDVNDSLIKILRVLSNMSVGASCGLRMANDVHLLSSVAELFLSIELEPELVPEDATDCKKTSNSSATSTSVLLHTLMFLTNVSYYVDQSVPLQEIVPTIGPGLAAVLLRLSSSTDNRNTEACMEAARIVGNLSRVAAGKTWIEGNRLDEACMLLTCHNDFRVAYNCVGVLINLGSGAVDGATSCRLLDESPDTVLHVVIQAMTRPPDSDEDDEGEQQDGLTSTAVPDEFFDLCSMLVRNVKNYLATTAAASEQEGAE